MPGSRSMSTSPCNSSSVTPRQRIPSCRREDREDDCNAETTFGGGIAETIYIIFYYFSPIDVY